MKRLLVAFGVLAVAGVWLSTVRAQPAVLEEDITLDARAPMRAFPHFWEQVFGSGRANLSLRESYRQDMRLVAAHTELRYVRFHAILDDENGVYDEDAHGRPGYNFSYVDQIYDGLLENHVKPFVELSFMPRKLAANLTPHPFWYKPLPSPPKDPAKWSALIKAFSSHLVERYGRDEVEQWYFEVWNEPNIDFWNGEPKQSTYFALYDASARAVKSVDPKIRIGGPATAQAAWVGAFIQHCTREGVPFDFVSTHVYGNENPEDVFKQPLSISRRDMVGRSAKKVYDEVKASVAPDTPIIWSEYNATYMNQPEITDSAFMGPWLANNIRECDGLTYLMSYWSFSDVFEEQGIVKTPFYGGFGLIAERHLPKAAFWAFDLLHRLGDRRVLVTSDNALVTVRPNGTFVVALWNYAEPGQKVASIMFRLHASGIKSYAMQIVSPGHGSVLKEWRDIGSPVSPTSIQIKALLAQSKPPKVERIGAGQPFILGPQTLVLLEASPQ